MAIIKWDPFAQLGDLHGQMNDLFTQAFDQQRIAGLTPTTDIYSENDKQMTVEVHLPNFTENEVSVDVHEGALEISAQHQEKQENKNKRKYLVRESSSSFYRRIALPKQANEDKVTAHFADGVLKVVVPFKELPKPKKVAIGTGKKK